MVANPSTNFGFMLFIECNVTTNSGGNKSQIHSAESSQEDLQPKVVIEYNATPIVTEQAKINSNGMSIHYNQSGNLRVSTKKDGNYSLLFHTGNGRLISRIENKNLKAGVNNINCGNLNLTKGLFVITLKNGGHAINSKAVIH